MPMFFIGLGFHKVAAGLLSEGFRSQQFWRIGLAFETLTVYFIWLWFYLKREFSSSFLTSIFDECIDDEDEEDNEGVEDEEEVEDHEE